MAGFLDELPEMAWMFIDLCQIFELSAYEQLMAMDLLERSEMKGMDLWILHYKISATTPNW